MNREAVLALLLENTDRYISGAEMAAKLSLSRSAVWKWVEQLRAEGYPIESATNRGYRLSSDNDLLSEAGIRKHLRHGELQLQVYDAVGSTNTLLKQMAAQGAPAGTVLVAGAQTQGRGRLGRSFYSPAQSGVYLSALLRPGLPAGEATAITCCAAVAVAEAVEALSGKEAGIKWVNDILLDGKKVSGILTEAALDWESGTVDYVVVGIGVNTLRPGEDFPPELRDIAGAVCPDAQPELRCRMAAEVLDRLTDYCARLGDPAIHREYRRRSIVLGRPIRVLSAGKPPVDATAIDVEPDFSLLVRYADGGTARLNSGEVSVRPLPGGAEQTGNL